MTGIPERFTDIFTPLTTEDAALSPDGRYLAYTERKQDELYVNVLEVDNPGNLTANMLAITDKKATPPIEIQNREPFPAQINWMNWVTPERLVIQTNQSYVSPNNSDSWLHASGAIISVNADGSNAETQVTPKQIQAINYNRDPSLDQEAPEAPYPDDQFANLHDDDIKIADAAGYNRNLDSRLKQTNPTRTIRSPHIVDFNQDQEGQVIIRAGPEDRFDLFSLDAISGDLDIVHTERTLPGHRVLLNRQQRAMISTPYIRGIDFPHPYLYDQPGTFFRWKDLDDIVELDRSTHFYLSPDNFIGTREIPLGFDEDPSLLYFASNANRDTYGLFQLDLESGKTTGFSLEDPEFDLITEMASKFPNKDDLIYDRYTRDFLGIRYQKIHKSVKWTSEEFERVYNDISSAFPDQSIELIGWDKSRQRFLFQAFSHANPGAFYIYDINSESIREFIQKDRSSDSDNVNMSFDFDFELPDGGRIHGIVTVPENPIDSPLPMVVLCPSAPWMRINPEYDERRVALAKMGFAVVEFNGRGASGFGKQHRNRVHDGYEVQQAQDIVTMIDKLSRDYKLNPEKVAVMGDWLGGFLALRTVQLHPEKFRCAISIDAPLNPLRWMNKERWTEDILQRSALEADLIRQYMGPQEHLAEAPLVHDAQSLLRPTLFFAYRKQDGTDRSPDYNNVVNAIRGIRSHGTEAYVFDLHRDYKRNLPEARARVFARIEVFLLDHMFQYEVTPGDIETLQIDSQ